MLMADQASFRPACITNASNEQTGPTLRDLRVKRRKTFITLKAIVQRRRWVKDNKDQDWRRVIFTDRSAIAMELDITTR
jgi:hypothetical protein